MTVSAFIGKLRQKMFFCHVIVFNMNTVIFFQQNFAKQKVLPLTYLYFRICNKHFNIKIHDITMSKYDKVPQPAFICPNLTVETPEQGVKYVQS